MLEFSGFADVLEQTAVLQKIYGEIRVTDPESGEVLFSQPEAARPGGKTLLCHQVWGMERPCENCISERALDHNGIFMKFVAQKKRVYQVTAVPITVAQKKLVMELIQDVTEKFCFEDEALFEDRKKTLLSISECVDELVLRDEMTGLFNRRFIDKRLPKELDKACRSGGSLSIVFIDIDRFKKINDTYGHLAGDEIIRGVAQLIRSSTRWEDIWAARYGGDEFLICFPGLDNRQAKKAAERMRASIEQEEFRAGGETLTATCSFGVKTVTGSECHISANDLIDQADKNLYLAKCLGRNRVV